MLYWWIEGAILVARKVLYWWIEGAILVTLLFCVGISWTSNWAELDLSGALNKQYLQAIHFWFLLIKIHLLAIGFEAQKFRKKLFS